MIRTAEVVRFSLADAQNALARSDDGNKLLPGDAELIAAYEGYCQQEWERLDDDRRAAEYAEWLADQCPACCEAPGATGPVCDECFIEANGEQE